MKVMIGYPPIISDKGVPLLSQNRQFQWFMQPVANLGHVADLRITPERGSLVRGSFLVPARTPIIILIVTSIGGP